ncbi:nucleoside phosphorylase domain-containing protein [Penicillium sp. IBT 31633x]|nr:nucleoside phosphorylase domain-containing protein [Penicillium sp. IBT 31633x]
MVLFKNCWTQNLNGLNQKPSSVDIPVVQEKVASLEGLQQALKESFDSLSVKVTQNAENMRNDYVTQTQWNELKVQVDNNSARITELSAVTRDTLGTTSLLLKVQTRSLGLFRSKGARDAKNEKPPEVASSNDVRKSAKTSKNPFRGNPFAAEKPNIGGPSGLPSPTQQSPVDTSMHDRFARYNPFSKDSTPRSVAAGYKIPAKQAIPRETRRSPSPPHSATKYLGQNR